MSRSRRNRPKLDTRAPRGPTRAAPRGQTATDRWQARDLLLPAGLFLAALLVRLIYLYESPDNPTFLHPIVDSKSYDALARGYAQTGVLTFRFFWQPLFYPLTLAALYTVSDGSILFAKVVQAGVGALTCLLTYLLGRRIFDRRVGLIAGIILVLYGPAIFFDGELLATTWAALWSVVLILLILRAAERESWLRFGLLGLCGGLATITRPTFLPFLLAAGLWLAWRLLRRPRDRRRASGALVALLAGFLLVALPVTVKYRQVVGQLGFLPISGGVNLYIGNNPDYEDTVTARPGTSEWLDLVGSDTADATGMCDRSRMLRDKVGQFARRQPLAFAGGLGRKAVQFLVGRETPRNIDVYIAREWSGLLWALLWKIGRFGFPWGLLLPLAVVGLVGRWRRVPAPIVFFIVLYPLSIVLVFVSARYRLPVVPVVAVLAGAGAVHLAELFSARRVGRLALAGGMGVATLVLTILPGAFAEERVDYRAEMYVWLGDDYRAARRYDDARQYYERALQSDPDSRLAQIRLGHLLMITGDPDQAITHLNQALVQKDDYLAYYYRGLSYQKRGDLALALGDLAAALEVNPSFGPAYLGRADLYKGLGRYDEARADCERARALPGYAEPARARLRTLPETPAP